MFIQMELPFGEPGEARGGGRSEEDRTAASGHGRSGTSRLIEELVEPANVKAALERVRKNKGGPGIDGMRVEELGDWVWAHWEQLREELLSGRYQPQPVRKSTIRKPEGGERVLGIPTVVDRFIQQGLLQVLQPRFDPTFSESSFGFRPGRRAHDAVRRAQQYIQEGRTWVVDIDLEKFFDRVNHDILVGRLAQRIEDRRVLGLIRRFLEAGLMADGVVIEREEGTPQGGPLSPLLANVLLDEVDKELERRGHAFVRYADDCNVYVRSKRAGERVFTTLGSLYGTLRLRINPDKSAVDLATNRDFLGYSFWRAKDGRVKLGLARKALKRLKARVRETTRWRRGRSLVQVVGELKEYLFGWRNYFRLADTSSTLRGIDQWIRRRLRCYRLRQWKRGSTAYRRLRARGVPHREAAEAAAHLRRWWRIAAHPALHTAFPIRFFDELGIPRFAT
jgi:RNA-directed DNA polymerase